MDSIRYAKRIQEAILPPANVVNSSLRNHFVLYKPKDIVSGDFYWVDNTENKVLVAAVDCTGHGVPGAFVSIVGSNGLHRTVKEYGLNEPNAILDKLNDLVVESLHQQNSDMKDGMDIALCSINFAKNEVEFSGANNPLYVVAKDERFKQDGIVPLEGNGYFLYDVRPDKQPIGGIGYEHKPFRKFTFSLREGESIYLFSDGFADQFGGEKGKKFKYSQLKELLLTMQGLTMEEQKVKLLDIFEKWRGELEQVDDVCVIGVRV
jgi:serine phosphatase RsbU (regulator of sigma subunit)